MSGESRLELDYTLLRGGVGVLVVNKMQYNTTTNHGLCAKTYNLVNTCVTVSKRKNITGIIKLGRIVRLH